MVYSPSGRPVVSSVWIVNVCVYVKLSRSILNSASRAANFWTISSTGIVGGPNEELEESLVVLAATARCGRRLLTSQHWNDRTDDRDARHQKRQRFCSL